MAFERIGRLRCSDRTRPPDSFSGKRRNRIRPSRETGRGRAVLCRFEKVRRGKRHVAPTVQGKIKYRQSLCGSLCRLFWRLVSGGGNRRFLRRAETPQTGCVCARFDAEQTRNDRAAAARARLRRRRFFYTESRAFGNPALPERG